MPDYPDPPTPSAQQVQAAKAYLFTLYDDEEATVKIDFDGTHTGCAVMIHRPLEGGPIKPPFKHDLNKQSESFTFQLRGEKPKKEFLISAWTFVGDGGSLPIQKGWWQPDIESQRQWDDHYGGRVNWSCPGSYDGPTEVAILITVAKTLAAGTA